MRLGKLRKQLLEELRNDGLPVASLTQNTISEKIGLCRLSVILFEKKHTSEFNILNYLIYLKRNSNITWEEIGEFLERDN